MSTPNLLFNMTGSVGGKGGPGGVNSTTSPTSLTGNPLPENPYAGFDSMLQALGNPSLPSAAPHAQMPAWFLPQQGAGLAGGTATPMSGMQGFDQQQMFMMLLQQLLPLLGMQ